jgi:CRP-like cAMP-binding protein
MALDDDIRRLAAFDLFRALEQDALRLLAFSVETRLLRAGDVIFREGDTSDGAYLLVTGAVDVTSAALSAPVRMKPVVLLGEVALVTETVRPNTVIACEPTTVLRITRTLFHRVLQEYPRSTARLRDTLAARLRATTSDLAQFAQGGDV